jgi:hypothetical protein
MTLRPSMAIVLLIPMRLNSSDHVARTEDARDFGDRELVQEAAARRGNVVAGIWLVKAAW